jgi:hypothetical protein
MGSGGARRRVLRCARAVLAASVLFQLLVAPNAAAVPPHATAGRWTLGTSQTVSAAHTDQGVATVLLPRGGERIVTRGNGDVSAAMRSLGWTHIGDPDSSHGYLLDAYQGAPSMGAKLFVLTAPDGHRSAWRHRLVRGESSNNSFVAIAPSARWFVAGEWGTIRRLLMFPMPRFNPAARPGRDLPLAATITLSRPIRNVQGCAFASATQLVCATNDTDEDLFGVARQLIGIQLGHPLHGHAQRGRPFLLGAVPQSAACGAPETEGLDVHGGRLLLVLHERGPCGSHTLVLTYRLRAAS